MPRLFDWSTRQEFLANTNNSIRINNLTRTPMQVAEAVAHYIRRQPTISPRPTYNSLTDYIINPKYNHFGTCDWLHLATDVAWPEEAVRRPERHTLSLGLRPADGPDSTEPRSGAKHFAELDLDQETPYRFNFQNLPMKLPLNVTTATQRWAIAIDSSSTSVVLSDPSVEGAVGGATLLLLQLESKAEKDIALQVVLNRPVMSRIHSEVWPDASCKDREVYFAGYHRAIGKYREPPVHEDGVLFLSADEAPVLSKLVANNAGYNSGLVGVEHHAIIQAGSRLLIPVLVIWVERPATAVEFRLLDVLMAIKADLIRQFPAEAVAG